ncbi:MAG: UvrD-helicase domain-containing protein [Gammaproteobacteria bacterium]|nr:UvrD-helicase domain-containing protein [Gammaproteobacteria bacterium]
MTKLAPDQLTRDTAIDVKRSFIVQAPAGAGKTSLLTQRILNLLTIVENPEEIVAVTFTRKAAAEMRHRLIESLHSASLPEPELAHERTSWQLANQVLQRDQQKQWQLLKNSHRLRILTIDSLSSLIANQMPLMSNLGGSLSIAEFPQESYQEAARSVISYINDAEYSDDLTLLLAHLDNQVERLVGLLAKMLAKRDQWLRLLGAGELDIGVLQQGITEIANLRLQNLAQYSQLLEDSCLLPTLHFAASYIDKQHPMAALREIEYLPDFDADHLTQWKVIADFCLTASGTFRKSLNKNQGLMADKDLAPEDKALGKQVKADIKAQFEAWSEVKGMAETLADINQFPIAVYSEEQQQILSSLLKLLRLATIELNVDFQSRSEADFIEIALAADRALGYFEEPSELALKLDYQISHILVDEFQDTSFTQYRLLNKLIAGWQRGDGRTLFLVGDPMQSIYRFREANVGLFIKTQQEGIGDIDIEALTLTANFRSSSAVIDWVNKEFSKIFPEQDDALLGAVSYSSAVAMKPSGEHDGVSFMASFDQSEQSEALQIAHKILQLKANNPEQSIAILVRGRTHAEPIAKALTDNRINFYAKDMQLLKYKAVIGDLLTLTRLLLQPQDAIAWIGFFKSPYLGLPLADIDRLQQKFAHNFWQWLVSFNQVQSLSSDSNKRLEQAGPLLSSVIKQQGRQPLSQLVETLWLGLGGPAALIDTSGVSEADAFFNILLDLEQQQPIISIEPIEAAISQLYAEQQKLANDVEIMTMHKSKGLEFDTVFLPSLEKRKRADEHQLLLWEEFSSGYQQHYLLAPIQAQETKEPIYQLARDIQSKKAQFEDARLLYVAATRAKKRLYLSCELKTKFDEKKSEWAYSPISKFSLLHYLKASYQPAIDQLFQELQIDESVTEDESQVSQAWYRLKLDRKLPQVKNSLTKQEAEVIEELQEIDFDWASDVARVVGVVLHQLLEAIGNRQSSFMQLIDSNFAAIKMTLAEHLSEQSEQEQALGKIIKSVNKMQQDPNLKWILQQHQAAVCEWPLSHKTQDASGDIEISNIVIDRSFIDENNIRWIIDYKTGEHLGSDLDGFFESEKKRYQLQLDKYAAAISQLESRPIKKALYYPMHQKLVELT